MLTDIERLRLLACVFTRPAFAEMARTGDYRAPFRGLLKAGVATEPTQAGQQLGAVFDSAWAQLAKGYRNEYVYKNDLASRLIFGRHSPRTAGFQLELPVGRSIVDVAVVNGTSTAYEIKTEYDTPRRLQSQTGDYLKVFDKVFVVTHPAHVARFERELDPRVGLIAMSPTGAMSVQRDAQSNAHNVDPSAVFRCLRRAEYLAAIGDIFGSIPQLPNGLIGAHCEKLFATVSPQEAHESFIKAIRARTTDENTVQFVANLPSCLRALGYATPLSKRQRTEILALLSKEVGLTLSI